MRKRLTVFIALALILSVCLIPSNISAEVDPIGVNSSIFYLDTENGGELLINLAIENRKIEPVEIEVSNWHDYTYPDETQQWIEPEWLESIEPSTFILPVGGQAIANVLYNIPEDADEIKYITWLKVSIEGWEKPITVIIRKGEASEAIDFSVSPSYYKILVESGDEKAYRSPIVVRNKCKNEVLAYASAEDRLKPLEITDSSSIQHTPEEVGTVYDNISTSEAQEWFSTPYTQLNPLAIDGYGKGDLAWSLDIPEDIPDGHYVFGVRIEAIQFEGSTSTININYLIWMLVDIERLPNHNNTNWLIIILALIIIGLGIYVAFPPLKNLITQKNKQEKNIQTTTA